MKKIGIITIYDCKNNGNRLQNYAVQEVLREIGVDAYTIRNIPFRENVCMFDSYIDYLHTVVWRFLLPKRSKADYHVKAIAEYDLSKSSHKKEAFQRFNELINFHSEWLTGYKTRLEDTAFDAFLVGSDQVWNYNYHRASRIDFLEFAGNKPKIAFSASIGVDVLDNSMKRKFKKYLASFAGISVREESARKLIQPLVNQRVKVLLDPTMAITRIHWARLAEQGVCDLPEKPYIVRLFLGDDKSNKLIERYVAENGYFVVNLGDPTLPYGPLEFLKCIQNAEMVFTDSFHACVFSIIFHTCFYALKRAGDDETIFTRIENLLEKFDFSDRILERDIVSITEERFNRADIVVEREREYIYAFLRDNIIEKT